MELAHIVVIPIARERQQKCEIQILAYLLNHFERAGAREGEKSFLFAPHDDDRNNTDNVDGTAHNIDPKEPA